MKDDYVNPQEFWQDARKELGYANFLSEEGMQALEAKAWEDGHASGYSEVYNCLIDLADLAEKLVKNSIKQLIANGLYFLPSPESKDYIEVATCILVQSGDEEMEDENGEALKPGSIVLFPH